jgi:hypothetical protein
VADIYIDIRNALAEPLKDFPMYRGGLFSGRAVKHCNIAAECCFHGSK